MWIFQALEGIFFFISFPKVWTLSLHIFRPTNEWFGLLLLCSPSDGMNFILWWIPAWLRLENPPSPTCGSSPACPHRVPPPGLGAPSPPGQYLPTLPRQKFLLMFSLESSRELCDHHGANQGVWNPLRCSRCLHLRLWHPRLAEPAVPLILWKKVSKSAGWEAEGSCQGTKNLCSCATLGFPQPAWAVQGKHGALLCHPGKLHWAGQGFFWQTQAALVGFLILFSGDNEFFPDCPITPTQHSCCWTKSFSVQWPNPWVLMLLQSWERLWEHVRLNCTTAAFWVFGCNSQGEHVGLSSGCCVWVLFSSSTGW